MPGRRLRFSPLAAAAVAACLAGAAGAPACETIQHAYHGWTDRTADPWFYGFPTLQSRAFIEVDACLTETEIALKSSVDFTLRGYRARWVDYLTWNVLGRAPTLEEVQWISLLEDGDLFYAIACGTPARSRPGWDAYMGWFCDDPNMQVPAARNMTIPSVRNLVAAQCYQEAAGHPTWVAYDQLRLLVKHHPIIDEIGWDNDVYFDKIWFRQLRNTITWPHTIPPVFLDVRAVAEWHFNPSARFTCRPEYVVKEHGGSHPLAEWTQVKVEHDAVLRQMFTSLLGDALPVCGDVDGNGAFGPADVERAQAALGCNPPPNACGTGNLLHCADVNDDGRFTSADVTRMRQHQLACAPDVVTRLFGLRGANLFDLVTALTPDQLRALLRPFVGLLASQA